MSSLSSLVKDRYIRIGDRGPAVQVLQAALQAAGYRIGTADGVFDGIFGDGTLKVVQRFQSQHGLTADGKVGELTAALLDAPHAVLVATAVPVTIQAKTSSGIALPHDDTASLMAFYGDPDAPSFDSQLVGVVPPFQLTYDGRPWPHAILLHRKCAPLFQEFYNRCWDAAGRDPKSPVLKRVSQYSGGHVNRPVRGSSRKSCHAFACAVDFDAEDLPMGKRVASDFMPIEVVNAIDSVGLMWGNRYVGRPDPMHIQAAHE